MTDVRALLKAKRQEARISHPYASYNASGHLKCSICATIIKHGSAWEGHLGSKTHRTNVIRTREEIRQQQPRQQDDDEVMEDADEPETVVTTKNQAAMGKRKVVPDESTTDIAGKKRKTEKPPSGFPSDFFSDPSRASVMLSDGLDEEDEHATKEPAEPITQSDVDLEYDRFQRELLGPPEVDLKEAYDRATVFAEPVVASSGETTGFPMTDAISMENRSAPTEEELRRKREEEERELIMDRLLEEERAQEDADTRVLLLKNKIELMRQKKREAKAKKG